MNDRLVVLIGGLLAMALVYVMLVPKPAPQTELSRPTSVDLGPHGLFALERWLSVSGLPTHSLRRRYDSLFDPAEIPADFGNIMVVTMPQEDRPRFDELQELLDWVDFGNTVVILAAIHDHASWASLSEYGFFLEDLRSITGAAPDGYTGPGTVAARSTSSLQDLTIRPLTASPLFPHPLLAGVETMQGFTFMGREEQALSMDDAFPLFALAADDETGQAVLWEQRIGNGRVILSTYASLLTNRALGHADNRAFVDNLVRYHLGADGSFIFDDMHQGLSALYDPEAFFADSRLHYTLYFLVGFWLLYLLGATNRIGEARSARREPTEADFVNATGQFIARRVSQQAVGERMFRNFFDEIRRRHNHPEDGEPVWDLLLRSPLIGESFVEQLRSQYRLLLSNRKIDLVKLHNQFNDIRKALS